MGLWVEGTVQVGLQRICAAERGSPRPTPGSQHQPSALEVFHKRGCMSCEYVCSLQQWSVGVQGQGFLCLLDHMTGLSSQLGVGHEATDTQLPNAFRVTGQTVIAQRCCQ